MLKVAEFKVVKHFQIRGVFVRDGSRKEGRGCRLYNLKILPGTAKNGPFCFNNLGGKKDTTISVGLRGTLYVYICMYCFMIETTNV